MQIKSKSIPCPGFVYMLGSDEFSWYKIGFSKSCEIRVSQLGILLPFKIELFAVWSSIDARALESELHEKCSRLHIHGEWFAMSWQVRQALIEATHETANVLIFPATGIVVKRAIASSSQSSANIKQGTAWKHARNLAKQRAVKGWLNKNGLEPTKENLSKAWQEAVLIPQKMEKYAPLDTL